MSFALVIRQSIYSHKKSADFRFCLREIFYELCSIDFRRSSPARFPHLLLQNPAIKYSDDLNKRTKNHSRLSFTARAYARAKKQKRSSDWESRRRKTFLIFPFAILFTETSPRLTQFVISLLIMSLISGGETFACRKKRRNRKIKLLCKREASFLVSKHSMLSGWILLSSCK